MKNIWTFENEKCDKMIIMEKIRTFYHIKELKQRNSSPSAPATKKAIRVSGWLFLTKSVLADGINPTDVG